MAELRLRKRENRKRCFDAMGWRWFNCEGIPHEGWKLHVSGNVNSAKKILRIIENTLVTFEMSFKFLPTTEDIELQTGVQTGKWLCIYPREIVNAFAIVSVLDEVLKSWGVCQRHAPKISTDMHVGETIIYARYGGFINDKIVGPDGGPYTWKRSAGAAYPTWVQNPWREYKADGSVNINKLRTFRKWPKHIGREWL